MKLCNFFIGISLLTVHIWTLRVFKQILDGRKDPPLKNEILPHHDSKIDNYHAFQSARARHVKKKMTNHFKRANTSTSDIDISVYYDNELDYSKRFDISLIPVEIIDRIYYSFIDPSSGECKFKHEARDNGIKSERVKITLDSTESDKNASETIFLGGNFLKLYKLKNKTKELDAVLSIGGPANSEKFHLILSKGEEEREKLAKSCGEFLLPYYQVLFSGVEVDFRFPCLANDTRCYGNINPKKNETNIYTDFLKRLRKHLPSKSFLAITTSSKGTKVAALDFEALNPIVDAYNTITYDFTDPEKDLITGFNSNVLDNSADPLECRRSMSCFALSNLYISQGAESSKVNIGSSFYGRGFYIAKGEDRLFANSLGPIYSSGKGKKIDMDYSEIKKSYLTNSNLNFDSTSKTSFIFDAEKGIFITMDDKKTLKEKIALCHSNSLGGIYIKNISGDTEDFELINSLSK